MSYLLTICIPTYNRGAFLERCLTSFTSQLAGLEDQIELLVSDNASSDNTGATVARYGKLFPIKYFRNEVNKGPDYNIATCFAKAAGKYVWIFGDDDYLMPDFLPKLTRFLQQNDFGVVHLVGVEHNEAVTQYHQDAAEPLVSKVYTTPVDFVKRVSYLVTFITGNIINKQLVPPHVDYYEFLGTYLIQINWTIQAIYAAKQNAVIETPIIACEQDNSGGYSYIKVFSENYNKIMRVLVRRGIGRELIPITNKSILANHLPLHIHRFLYRSNAYTKEYGFLTLLKCFWPYYDFWRKIATMYLRYWAGRVVKKLKFA